MLLIVSVTASLLMLILGFLIGYTIKTNYSKTIIEKFDLLLRKKQMKKPPCSSAKNVLHTYKKDILSSSSLQKCEYSINTNRPFAESCFLQYGLVGKKTSLSPSSSSNSFFKLIDNCSRQNCTTNSDKKQAHLKFLESKNPTTSEYFTVQNDYSILPLASVILNDHSLRDYQKKTLHIVPPQVPLQHRLSFTSSSTTNSSDCGVASNLINSHTCLLNVISGVARTMPKQSYNSSCEVEFCLIFDKNR